MEIAITIEAMNMGKQQIGDHDKDPLTTEDDWMTSIYSNSTYAAIQQSNMTK